MAIKEQDRPSVSKGNGNARKKEVRANRRWFTASKVLAPRLLNSWVKDIETTAWPRRFANLTYYRYMTGRPVNPAYHYSMVARPSAITATYGRSLFRAPVFNAMAQCDDVLANRVYKSRPFIQVCPIAGDFGARVKAKKLTRWMDAAFYDLDLWPIIEMCGQDARMYGTAYLMVDEGLDGNVAVTRIQDDEIVIDETECSVSDDPKTFAVRIFVNRDEALASLGTDDEKRQAIEDAPSASLGFYFGSDLDVSDVIVLVRAWHLGTGDTKGRQMLIVGDKALVDKPYTRDHFPVAKLPYRRLSSGWRGQGLAEQLLPLQRELERWLAAASENMQRVAWPRVGIESSANINEAALAGKSGGTYKFTKTPAVWQNPEALGAEQFKYGEMLIRMIRERTGISDQAAAGVKPSGLNSGLAIEKQAQIDDGRHVELSQHLEDFVRDVGTLLIEAAEKCKPTVTLPGRRAQQIKWSDVNMAASSYWLRPFPMSSLPQSIAGRQQIIDTWAAEGRISKQTQGRLEQLPDIDGYQDTANSGMDWVEATLDEIVEDGHYNPPTPFADLGDQLAAVQSRWAFEDKQGDTPQDRLDMLLQYWAAVQEMIEETVPPPTAAPPSFGVAPPAGGPPLPTQGNPLPVNVPVPTPMVA